MKNIIPILAITVTFAACNSKPEATQPVQVQSQQVQTMTPEDSLVLSQFRAWKAQNELADAQAFLNGGQNPNQNVANNSSSSTTRSSSATRRSSGSSSSGSGAVSSSSSQTAKKKGWSSAAKGAVIGGVAGAAGGAVINKRNRAVGAVVGGILGAGVGYGIGRSKDVKSGRAN